MPRAPAPTVTDIASLLRHAAMSTTYKPALLKAIVRLRSRGEGPRLNLQSVGREFARMYWNQTIVYRLRQASVVSKEPEVLRAIREFGDQYGVRAFVDLPEEAKAKLGARMAKILTINVLALFHKSKPEGMAPVFEWKKGDSELIITTEALDLLTSQRIALETVANYFWARFLQSCNRLAPHIIRKVERDDAKRRSLAAYLKILREDETSCFYCGRDFGLSSEATVDHVIPWSFLMDDPIWDCVLACRPCNQMKSDWLPDEQFIAKLLERNSTRERKRFETKVSFLSTAGEIEKLYEAAVLEEWPRYWSPAPT